LAAPLPEATPRTVSRAARVPASSPSTVSPPSTPAPVRTSSGAGAAIAAARAELGKPYAWGASGPGSFDCSGLTAWAWRAAGVNLPHSAAAQQGMGSPVSRGNLQPGDLVFFGSPAYHVAMYLGGGLVIHAPTTGDVVKIVSLTYLSDYSGASRVG
jgi:cell wall-associated NlpC family hydrolase